MRQLKPLAEVSLRLFRPQTMGMLPYVVGYRAGYKAAGTADGAGGTGYDAAYRTGMQVAHPARHHSVPCCAKFLQDDLAASGAKVAWLPLFLGGGSSLQEFAGIRGASGSPLRAVVHHGGFGLGGFPTRFASAKAGFSPATCILLIVGGTTALGCDENSRFARGGRGSG